VEAVLFDWDGTLADSLESFYTANAAVLAELGIPFDRRRYREVYSPDWRRFYRRLGVPEDRLEEANDRWTATHVPAAEPMPGAREALVALAGRGSRLGIVTATSRRIVEPQLERFGMADLLTVRVFGGDLSVGKPDPGPLELALERSGLAGRPRLAVYVGDAPDDMRMARAVGTRAIGVRSMLGDEADLLDAGAESVHGSVADWVRSELGRPIAAA
jgi:HAD superfamily hydrolase (TIGR01509 family)